MANLTIKTTAPHRNIRVVAYSGLQNAESEGSLIGVLNPTGKPADIDKTVSIEIDAGQAFRFSTTLSDTISIAGKIITSILCKTHSRFQPQAGARYLAHHSSPTSSNCQVEVFRLDANDKKIPEPSLEDLAWCIDPKLDDPSYLVKYPDKACP